MKNFWKIIGVFALVAIIGFSMLSCGGGSGKGGLTITGLPSEYNGKYVWLQGNGDGALMCYAGVKGKIVLTALVSDWQLDRISNGSVTTSVWEVKSENKGEIPEYKGNGTFKLDLVIVDKDTLEGGSLGAMTSLLTAVAGESFKNVTFTNGKAKLVSQKVARKN